MFFKLSHTLPHALVKLLCSGGQPSLVCTILQVVAILEAGRPLPWTVKSADVDLPELQVLRNIQPEKLLYNGVIWQVRSTEQHCRRGSQRTLPKRNAG